MEQLAKELMDWIFSVKGNPYDRPDTLPEIRVEALKPNPAYVNQIPLGQFSAAEGEGPIIRLAPGWTPNPAGKSVLLHELVHYVQWWNDVEFERERLEFEAYSIQARWLIQNGYDPESVVHLSAARYVDLYMGEPGAYSDLKDANHAEGATA